MQHKQEHASVIGGNWEVAVEYSCSESSRAIRTEKDEG